MKLSAYHKSIDDVVDWFDPMTHYLTPFDKIYSSKVFTFTDIDHYLPKDAELGGTGYGIYENLPEVIDKQFPDYSIYPSIDYAIGFMSRGCPNKCGWCVVPKKEGNIKPYRTWKEIKRHDSRDIIFMDNNAIASDFALSQMQELSKAKHNGLPVRVDFNQGLDARLVTKEIAQILAGLHWLNPLRMACDQKSQMPWVEQATAYLREAGCKPVQYSCYVLVKDIPDALERVEFLRRLNVDPFAQPYRDFDNMTEPSEEQRRFARWVNHKAIFKTTTWADYKSQ